MTEKQKPKALTPAEALAKAFKVEESKPKPTP